MFIFKYTSRIYKWRQIYLKEKKGIVQKVQHVIKKQYLLIKIIKYIIRMKQNMPKNVNNNNALE